MKKHIVIILGLFISILLSGCSEDKKNIENTIKIFYKNYNNDFREIENDLLTIQLQDYLIQVKNKENLEKSIWGLQKTSKLKPNIIKEDLFLTSNSKSDSLFISNIDIKNDTAIIPITHYNHSKKIKWNDTVEMINENGWKINNVYFDNNINKSTHKIIIDYLK
jgi:hypothetical protein